MNPQQIALQLYTVRDSLTHDFETTIRKIAAMGYAAVEPAGIYGDSLESAARLFRELGLHVCSAHVNNREKMAEVAGAFGIDTIVWPWLPPERFKTLDGVKAVCDELNETNSIAQKNGLRLAYHNHDFEFTPLPDGTLPHVVMRQLLDPSVLFELDIYWIKTAGSDPATVIRELGSRAPLLHLKDGPAQHGVPMTALGEGVVDIRGAIGTGASSSAWYIVEMDQVAGDTLEAVQKSYSYLKAVQHGS